MEYTIVGGGIAGLTTALAFEKLGIKYKLFDKAKTIEAVGAGIWLSPNALQVLEWISQNLLKSIQNTGNELDRILVADNSLKSLSDSDQRFVKKHFGYSTIAIHRGKLQQLLYEFVNKQNIELNKEFKKYVTTENGSIDVIFTDGSTYSTKYILGADGINSKVRKQMFPESKIRYTGQTCWRGVSSYSLDTTLEKNRIYTLGQKTSVWNL